MEWLPQGNYRDVIVIKDNDAQMYLPPYEPLTHSNSSFLCQSFLMVGYATIYTQLPVFSLVLDKDVTPKIAMDFPELYKELTKGRCRQYLKTGTQILQ